MLLVCNNQLLHNIFHKTTQNVSKHKELLNRIILVNDGTNNNNKLFFQTSCKQDAGKKGNNKKTNNTSNIKKTNNINNNKNDKGITVSTPSSLGKTKSTAKSEKLKNFSFVGLQIDDKASSKRTSIHPSNSNLNEVQVNRSSITDKLAKLINKDEPGKEAQTLLERKSPTKNKSKLTSTSSSRIQKVQPDGSKSKSSTNTTTESYTVNKNSSKSRNSDTSNKNRITGTGKKEPAKSSSSSEKKKLDSVINLIRSKNHLQLEDQVVELDASEASVNNRKNKTTNVRQSVNAEESRHEDLLREGKGLNLFTLKEKDTTQETDDDDNSMITIESPVWSMHYSKELKDARLSLPLNGFDEMITLTNEKKLWSFPINNEQEKDEVEASVPFYEHVFLEDNLKDFPNIEPIQQFMILTLNGISQNSFLNIGEKRAIIEWYKEYFSKKSEIIKMALETEKLEEENENFQRKRT